jgi:hypothetical protein
MSSAEFHKLAKDAGNRLKGYILAYSSAATGVFFLSLSGKEGIALSVTQKSLLIASLLFYVATVVISLVELKVDARRFFYVAKEMDRLKADQNWARNEHFKVVRRRLIFTSYWTAGAATACAVAYLVARIA